MRGTLGNMKQEQTGAPSAQCQRQWPTGVLDDRPMESSVEKLQCGFSCDRWSGSRHGKGNAWKQICCDSAFLVVASDLFSYAFLDHCPIFWGGLRDEGIGYCPWNAVMWRYLHYVINSPLNWSKWMREINKDDSKLKETQSNVFYYHYPLSLLLPPSFLFPPFLPSTFPLPLKGSFTSVFTKSNP